MPQPKRAIAVQPIASWNSERDVWESPTQSLLSEHSDVYSETWPTSGSMRNGSVFLRPEWEHPISVADSLSSGSAPKGGHGLLPTPRTSDTNGGESMGREGLPSGPSTALLPTPTSNLAANGGSQNPEKRREGGHSVSLQDVIEHL